MSAHAALPHNALKQNVTRFEPESKQDLDMDSRCKSTDHEKCLASTDQKSSV
jgi:hypothetical protein